MDIYGKYADIFILIANLEQASDSITDSKAKNEFYRKHVTKYSKDWESEKIDNTVSRIMKAQRDFNEATKYFLEKLETNVFILNFNRLSTNRISMD